MFTQYPVISRYQQLDVNMRKEAVTKLTVTFHAAYRAAPANEVDARLNGVNMYMVTCGIAKLLSAHIENVKLHLVFI